MSHLSRERLSQIVDEGADPATEAHLSECALCRRELEAIRGLATELGALPGPPVPEAVWGGVVRRLVAEGELGTRRRRPAFRVPLQAAAAVAVLAAGFTAGRTTAPRPPLPAVTGLERPATVEQALRQVEVTGDAYRQAVAQLGSFRGTGGPTEEVRLAAERLAALDALVDASRAALRVVPEDPIVNGYLYAALQERQRLTASLASTQAFWR